MSKLNLKTKISRCLNSGFVIYLVLLSLPLYLVKFSIFNIPTTILEVLIYILTVWFLLNNFWKKDFKKYFLSFLKNPFIIPLILFLIAGLISVFILPEKRIALGIFKAYFFDPILFFFLFVCLIKEKSELKKSFLAIIISATMLCLVGLIQYFLFPQYLQEGRIRSIFSSPNYLSLYITPISFFCFTIFDHKKWLIFFKNPLLYFYLVILSVIILTFSRGAWLGLLLGLVFFFGMLVLNKFKTRGLKIFFASLFLTGFIASFFFIIYGSYSFGLVPQNRIFQSDNIRKEVWVTSLDIGLKHKWLGIGLGNFQNYFGEYTKNRINYPEYITPNAVTPHNIFLNIWLQTGLLGLLALLGLLGLFFIKCFKGLKKEFLFNLILISAMTAILGQGLVDSAIWKNDLMIIFIFLVASASVINTQKQNLMTE